MKIKYFYYKYLPYNEDNINKYKDDNNMLIHARSSGCFGRFIVTRKTDKLIGYIGIEDDTIISLEVSEKYRGRGFAKDLINYAIQHGANKLSVNKNNENAIDMYKHLGWKKYKSDDNMIYMKYKNNKK